MIFVLQAESDIDFSLYHQQRYDMFLLLLSNDAFKLENRNWVHKFDIL